VLDAKRVRADSSILIALGRSGSKPVEIEGLRHNPRHSSFLARVGPMKETAAGCVAEAKFRHRARRRHSSADFEHGLVLFADVTRRYSGRKRSNPNSRLCLPLTHRDSREDRCVGPMARCRRLRGGAAVFRGRAWLCDREASGPWRFNHTVRGLSEASLPRACPC
jgi:hypothetical protein